MSISSRFSNLLEYRLSRALRVVFQDFMDIRGVRCYLALFISDFTDLGVFSPHFSQDCRDL
jgi:hypothetical protein